MPNSTLQTVSLATAALGVVSGFLGSFAVLRKQSLLGDAVSHAALPGIALAFVLFGSSPLMLLLGAALAGWVSIWLVTSIHRSSRIPFDSALGGTLAVFFGLGLLGVTYIQKHIPGGGQLRLQDFLFGQAATMREQDLWTIVGIGALALFFLMLFWKEFKLLCFDPDYALTLGYPVRFLDLMLLTLIVLAIVIGLQSVGVVLMSAMLVAPAAAARQWTDRLGVMTFLAAFFGGLSGAVGTILSSEIEVKGRSLPPGPTIVLVATSIVLLSCVVRYWRQAHSIKS